MPSASVFTSWLRREPIIILAPFLVGLGVLHFNALSSESGALPAGGVLPLQEWALGLSIVFLVGPAASACAAYLVGRLKNADIFARRWVRERLIIVRALGVTAVVSLIIIIVFGLYQAGLTAPHIRLLLVATMSLLQMLAWGTICAFLLPSLLAVPLALVGGYMWMVLPMAVEPLWLRHINGYWPTCCAIDQSPSLSGMAGVFLVMLSAWVAAYGLMHKKTTLRRVSAVASLALFSAALFSVSHLGADPVEERKSGLTCQPISNGDELCLFTEHEKYRAHAENLLVQVSQQWSGVIPHGQVRYSESSYDIGAVHVDFSPKRPEEEIIMLAQAHLPRLPQCDGQPYENGKDRDLAFEGLLSLAGVSVDTPDKRVNLMLDMNESDKAAWFAHLFEQAKLCSAPGK